jgi:hypothetical protein
LRLLQHGLHTEVGRRAEVGKSRRLGAYLAKQFNPLYGNGAQQVRYSSNVAAGTCQRCNESRRDRIRRADCDDRNSIGQAHQGTCACGRVGEDNLRSFREEFLGKPLQPIVNAVRPAPIYEEILPLDVSKLAHPRLENPPETFARFAIALFQDRDPPHFLRCLGEGCTRRDEKRA